MSANATGPAELRRLIQQQRLWLVEPERMAFEKQAAAWEADLAALERARALLRQAFDGLDDYWITQNPKVITEIYAALAPDGAR